MTNIESYDQSLDFFLAILSEMTPSELRITHYFSGMYRALRSGGHLESRPSKKTIAKESNCCIDTVSVYLHDYGKLIFEKYYQPKGRTVDGERYSNVYQYKNDFWNFVCYLVNTRRLKKMIKEGKNWIKKCSENREAFLEEIGYNSEVMNNAILRGGTTKSYANILIFKKRKEVPQNTVPAFAQNPRNPSDHINLKNLKPETCKFINDVSGTRLIHMINADIHYAKHNGVHIHSPDGWVLNRAKANLSYLTLKTCGHGGGHFSASTKSRR